MERIGRIYARNVSATTQERVVGSYVWFGFFVGFFLGGVSILMMRVMGIAQSPIVVALPIFGVSLLVGYLVKIRQNENILFAVLKNFINRNKNDTKKVCALAIDGKMLFTGDNAEALSILNEFNLLDADRLTAWLEIEFAGWLMILEVYLQSDVLNEVELEITVHGNFLPSELATFLSNGDLSGAREFFLKGYLLNDALANFESYCKVHKRYVDQISRSNSKIEFEKARVTVPKESPRKVISQAVAVKRKFVRLGFSRFPSTCQEALGKYYGKYYPEYSWKDGLFSYLIMENYFGDSRDMEFVGEDGRSYSSNEFNCLYSQELAEAQAEYNKLRATEPVESEAVSDEVCMVADDDSDPSDYNSDCAPADCDRDCDCDCNCDD